jgi:4-carboxymuconolactone decarboxylase
MQLFAAMLTALVLFTPASMEAQTMVMSRGGSRAVRTPPPDNFTGSVRVEMLFEALDPSHASGGYVTFEPRARTAWHAHPRGQILIVTAGTGRVQRWGGPIEEIRAGDVVRIPAGQKHWHGASPQSAMTHLAVSEHREGTAVEWMEQVSDDQYDATVSPPQAATRPSGPRQQALAPGLAVLTDDVLFGDVWRRPELSPRDRSLVTISVLIATGRTAQLAGHLGRGLDNGIQSGEASGLLAHLAIYSGWPSAVSALDVYEQVYTARHVDTGVLRTMGPRLAAPASDASRAKTAADRWSAVAPKFVELTNTVVFDDLWRRSDLTPRDRSLVTLAALAATGDDDQLELYVQRGLESGLTRAQIAEAMTHLGFYAGWGKATAAMTAVTRLLAR